MVAALWHEFFLNMDIYVDFAVLVCYYILSFSMFRVQVCSFVYPRFWLDLNFSDYVHSKWLMVKMWRCWISIKGLKNRPKSSGVLSSTDFYVSLCMDQIELACSWRALNVTLIHIKSLIYSMADLAICACGRFAFAPLSRMTAPLMTRSIIMSCQNEAGMFEV